MHIEWTEQEIHRYARHILLPELGGIGQDRLRRGRVLVAGAGGLGSPVALYLAAAGVGTIGLVDDDHVELSNLQRQVLHDTASIGRKKVESGRDRLSAINPLVDVRPLATRIDARNVDALVAGYDLVCDGTDNFETRFLLADAACRAQRTLVSAAILRFEGQIATFKPHATGPCYRCLHPDAPPVGLVPSCAEAGILGSVAGVMGSLQATEAIKELAGIGDTLAGRLLLWDALGARMRTIELPRDPDCAFCRNVERDDDRRTLG